MEFFTEVVKVTWKIFWRRNFRIPVIGVIAVIADTDPMAYGTYVDP
jgi:hypothetical protein